MHFSDQQWIDFARGLTEKSEMAKMQAHLESGCRECADALHAWSQAREIAGRLKLVEAPEVAVKSARALAAIHGPKRKRNAVRLLFDSLLTPSLAGVRASATLARQLLYAVDGYRIDFRLEPETNSDKVAIVGQILHSAMGNQAADIAVELRHGRRVLDQARTNAFGEFHLLCELEGRLQLRLILPGRPAVQIPLVEPGKTSITGSLETEGDSEARSGRSSQGRGTRKKV